MDMPPLRYLSAADVAAAMPGVEERLELAATTMLALIEDADLPPKIAVHPAPADSFAHAMPAWMRGPADHRTQDLLGMKWVTGFPDNAAAGLATIHATLVLNDARTGLPRAFLDAGTITAHRTAAVSGVAISRWGPMADRRSEGRLTVALIGAGVQARSHLPVIAHLLPGADVVLCDRDRSRLDELAGEVASGRLEGTIFGPDGGAVDALGELRTTTRADEAVAGADLVVTMVSFGPQRQSVPEAAFAPAATVVAIDYDMCVPASLAASAGLFLTDDGEQFRANRSATAFAGYPDPSATLGEAIRARLPQPDGRVLISHLGVGLADVVFGDAILRAAESQAIGTLLER